MANSKPVQEIRLGRIKAAIWENQTENGPRHNVTVSRLYKDGEEWKTADSFGRDDLPLLAKAVDLAHTWIFTKTQDGITQTPGEDAEDRKRNSNRSRSAA
jgi:hypothetical protein